MHAQSQADDPAAPPANPQTAPNDPTQGPEIIVTGTSIKGAAPVGSHLIQVDQQQIRDSGVQNTADLLATIPQLGSFGTTRAWAAIPPIR
ncbi:hypothetical protein [Novosphingobium sp. 9]|uniref:hypothetical protein n=1 Tax=Novosphingobium sp. 9 TaxID=2025349 RepID=UPI0021B5B2A3|nr:hypothetical protein [Novosphingobium sp. 9]